MIRNKDIWIIAIILLGAAFFLPGCSKSKENATGETVTETEAAGQPVAWPFEIGPDMTLEENPVTKNYYFIFDGSGSMNSNQKIQTAKKALKEFVRVLPADAKTGLLAFGRKGLSERHPLSVDRNSLIREIDSITASGRTPLKSAIEMGYNKLTSQGRKQLGYGEYNIVIITDGEASEGEDPRRVVNLILKESPVVIHTIGFQIGTNHSLNQPGKIYYKSANNLQELTAGLENVLAELEDFSLTNF